MIPRCLVRQSLGWITHYVYGVEAEAETDLIISLVYGTETAGMK